MPVEKSIIGMLGQDEIFVTKLKNFLASCKQKCIQEIKKEKHETCRFSSVVYNQYNYYYNK